MPSLNLIRAFLQHASTRGSRSTVMNPVAWMITICISATLSSAYLGLASWVTCMFAVFCGLTMILYLGAYLYCLATDKDALRSETYTIQKLAIEKGFVGDSLTGELPMQGVSLGKFLESTTEVSSEVDK